MSDYLWDKTGDADPDVASLEELLGELRYRPQKFELLMELPAAGARRAPARRTILFWPALAAAAALILMTLAGLWLTVVRRDIQRPSRTVGVPSASRPEQIKTPTVASNGEGNDEFVGTAPKRRAAGGAKRPAKNLVPRRETSSAEQRATIHSPKVEEAKRKLMLALQLTSAELSFVQRKTGEVTSMRHEREKTN